VSFGLKLIQNLQEKLDLIYFGLEHGLERARDHFSQSSLNPNKDKQAFSNLVRLHAKHYLNNANVEAFELDPFTNLCGIWARIDDYLIKVLKISEDDLKKALTELTGKDEQLHLLIGGQDLIARLHLHLFWITDDSGFQLETYLAYPRYPDAKNHNCHWCLEISEPTARMQTPQTGTGGGDLDISGAESIEATG
jgi:hypothetical protein